MGNPDSELRSSAAGVVWPASPAPSAALLLSLLFQFERSQWFSPAELLAQQLRQLEMLLKHARATVPYYQECLPAVAAGAQLTSEAWRDLPLLTRRDVQSAGDALVSRAVPAQFGRVTPTQSSGSTGEPVKLHKTAVDQLFWEAITLRDHAWHRRDLSGKLAAIRVFPHDTVVPAEGVLVDDWGAPTNKVYVTGPLAVLSLATDVTLQAQWLKRHDPDYLLTYATNLSALIAHFSARGEVLPKLREVRTVGETVTPALRAACRENWGVPLVDLYSSQEVGYIALQCPRSENYHVMSETVLVEVLDRNGRPCEPGEIGRLVVSSLHNFATPLIRYELRDYAEVGAPCACGRGLPTLARILGRSRNMLTLPSGEQQWPLTGSHHYREIAPVRQFQMIQRSREEIEVRLVVDQPLSAEQESRLTEVIRDALGHPFAMKFVYFDRDLPRGPGGKFEEFVSDLE
jgi:phenylacetate-CoA ligase